MKPTFRSDLTCSREEQQGVVFYRIDDPRAQTSFRLYEIEYLIAKKLDGSRELAEVIAAVKGEFNFDISEADLQRFVNQLESMGFLQAGTGIDPSSGEPEQETAVMERPVRPAGQGDDGEHLELLDAEPLVEEQSDVPDQAELHRLMRSAFLHVKQGYVAHARDYFLAARELNPNDTDLQKLVHHLEIIGDASGPAEVEYLWNQARELFPDIADEVGPLADMHAQAGDEPFDSSLARSAGEEDLKSRVLWALVAIAILAGGVGALAFVFTNYGHRILGTAARVRVAALKAERIAVYYDGGASEVSPLEERWMVARSNGEVDQVHVKVGDTVEEGQVLVRLHLADRMAKQLQKAQRGYDKASAAYNKAAKRMEKLNAEREAIETERTAAEERLKELTPKSVLKHGGVSKRDLEKWKNVKVEANRKLSRLAKKERGPRKQLAKARKKRAAAQSKLDGVYEKIAPKLVRADVPGVVGEIKVQPGDTVSAKTQLVLLTDPSGVELIFSLPDAPVLQPGGEAHVSVSRGVPSQARVLRVDAAGNGAKVAVRLSDPSGGFQEIAPEEFRLVREFADPAFSVPTSALVDGQAGAFLLVAERERALRRSVTVLDKNNINAIVRDNSGTLRDGVELVVSSSGDVGLADLPEGSFLEVEP